MSASAQYVHSELEEKTGWKSCDVCSGPAGEGDDIKHSMSQNISSPSRDGRGARFSIAANDSSDRYGSALWWKEVGGRDSSRNFVLELDFYLKDPGKAQALEFDVNQLHDGHNTKYIFGTECDIKGTGRWRFYDNVNRRWASTSIACNRPTAYTWHHLVLEFKRTSDNKIHFVAVTLNGKKSYFNKYSGRRTGTARYAHINGAIQLDGNSTTQAYSMWVDNVKVKHW